MSQKQAVRKLDPRVREAAAEWFVALGEREVDAAGRESFDGWLRSSPEHVRAFLQISALWDGAAHLVDSLPAGVASNPRKKSLRPMAWKSAFWPIAACLLLVTLVAGGVVWWQVTRAPTYQTAAAEVRTVRLPDGSIIQLNARSRVDLRFTTQRRAVDLVAGQALFSVAKDPKRPFVVRSGPAHVTAVGTRFDVYRKSRGTIVTVLEGRVALAQDELADTSRRTQKSVADKPPASVLVSAGEQAEATLRNPIQARPANIFAATAWTEGKLVFDSAPLREIVAEFNRVGSRRIVIEDDSLLELHLSGVFPAADPTPFVGFLRARFGVSVAETSDEVRVERAGHKR